MKNIIYISLIFLSLPSLVLAAGPGEDENYGLDENLFYTFDQLAENPFIKEASPMARWGLKILGQGNDVSGREAIAWARKNLKKGAYNNYLEQMAEDRAHNQQIRIEKDRLDLRKDEIEHKAKLDNEQMINGIKARFEGLRTIMNDKRGMMIVGGTVVGVVGASAVLYYGAKHGIPLLFRHKPQIVNETSLPETLYQTVFGKERLPSRLKEIAFNPDLEADILRQIAIIKRSVKRKKPLSNLLFYGLPGTGKSLTASEIARHSGAEYISINGADLFQLPPEEAIQQLKELLIYSRSSPNPVALYIDEADAIFAHRKQANDLNRKLTNTFLGLVEKPSDTQLFIILATNHPDELDSAVLSRISKGGIFHFAPPTLETRTKLIGIYMQKTFKSPLITSSDLEENKIKIAERLDNWTGRDIEQLMIDTYNMVDYDGRTLVETADLMKMIDQFKKNQIANYNDNR